MTNKFAQALIKTDSDESVSITENGARGYARTSSRLVDFFFKVGSMRNMSESDIEVAFAEAFAEDKRRAVELLFFVRDCRGGIGEKRTFNICFNWLIKNASDYAVDTVKLIPEYGSWKTFIELTNSFRQSPSVEDVAKRVVKDKALEDMSNYGETRHCSLLAKWLPSENTSSKNTQQLARYWREVLGMKPREYRKMLTKLRACLKVVEADMSAGSWGDVNYNSVPAKAGQIYAGAFLKHDKERREQWLADLKAGKSGVKINTAGLSVPELVHRYIQCEADGPDETIEAAWRDLVAKNRMDNDGVSLIPVVDGSGSMYAQISRSSSVEAIDVSIGLGLFLANINTPAWRGYVMEYGSNPCFFKVPVESTLYEQVKIARSHDDCGSTNVKAVFDLILETARREGMTQKDIPEVITFSDMEFDSAYMISRASRGFSWNHDYLDGTAQEALFKTIAKEWNSYGYQLPRLTFWNVNSRTGTIPLTENKLGVALLSGYSQSIMDMVLSRKFNPLEVLLEKLDSKRYDLVRQALA